MFIHPMGSPTACLVSIEVNYLTVTSDCSCLVIIIIIDREVLSVNLVIGLVAVVFFFFFFFHLLRVFVASAKSSNSIIIKLFEHTYD